MAVWLPVGARKRTCRATSAKLTGASSTMNFGNLVINWMGRYLRNIDSVDLVAHIFLLSAHQMHTEPPYFLRCPVPACPVWAACSLLYPLPPFCTSILYKKNEAAEPGTGGWPQFGRERGSTNGNGAVWGTHGTPRALCLERESGSLKTRVGAQCPGRRPNPGLLMMEAWVLEMCQSSSLEAHECLTVS